MTAGYTRQNWVKRAAEALNATIVFSDMLEGSEVLNGTPTVEEVTTSDLTFSSVSLNAATVDVTIDGGQVETIPINNAVQCLISGGNADTDYVLEVTSTTDGGQTIKRLQRLRVIA